MKKSILYILVMIGLLATSCEKDNSVEPIFEGTINERADKLKTEYVQALSAPENGWIGYYSPNAQMGTFALLLKFDANGNVQMTSDYNFGANNAEITYRIDKTLKMELVFESHSVLHQIYEIDRNSVGGEYVFNITSVSTDEVVLTSKTDNGYNDEVTELRLQKASTTDWNLDPYYASFANLLGDGTQSVFRSIINNGSAIASIDINADRRYAVVSYIDGGELTTIQIPLKITQTGFSFIEPITIGSVTLEDFSFDADNNAFVDAGNNSVVYASEPAVPLTPYDFGKKDALYNFVEVGKSSPAFSSFYGEYLAWLESMGVQLGRVYFNDLLETVSYVFIQTNYGNFWYDFNYDIEDGTKVYFTLTGATNTDETWSQILQPLIDVLLGSTKGYFIKGTGGLQGYTNNTFSLINADNPAFEINYIDL